MKNPATRHHHLGELQSIRGIAALLVVLHHSSFAIVNGGRFHYVVEAAFNAHAAVVFFFVLSGFVLTRGLIGGEITWISVARFYVARAFRIYPALLAAVVLLGLYYAAGAWEWRPIGLSDWLYGVANQAPKRSDYILVPLGLSSRLMSSLWTIRIELQASLLMPLMAVFVQRGWFSWLALEVVLLAIAISGLPGANYGSLNGLTTYLAAFGAGASVCLWVTKISTIPLATARVLAILALIGMMFFRLMSPDWRFLANYGAVPPTLVEAALGSICLGLIAAKRDLAPFLRQRWLVSLGDISYSLYLSHFVILFVIAKGLASAAPDFTTLHPYLTTLALGLLTLTISLPLASILYRYIEVPGIALGKTVWSQLLLALSR